MTQFILRKIKTGGVDGQFQTFYDTKMTIEIKTTLGLHLVRSIAKAIGYKMFLHSQIEQATEMIVNLKFLSIIYNKKAFSTIVFDI